MRPRDVFTWKLYFYRVLLPALRLLGPERADAVLGWLGRASSRLWPPRRRRLARALAEARRVLGGGCSGPDRVGDLAAGIPRFLARDYLLDTDDDREALALFDVTGGEALAEALDAGRGAVLVGGHFGGHVAAFHWLYRRGVPLRLMVQRPKHVSAVLDAFFDREEAGPDPQLGYFLSRSLNPAECVARMVRARSALRSGRAVYFPGDVPWSGPNTRTGRLLGRTQRLLSVWADLAAITGAPVFFVFCAHRPGGRFALSLEPLGPIAPGGEADAVARYLAQLETSIAASPADAVAHLLWPCYSPALADAPAPGVARPGRRVAVVNHT
jgi:lauroyl/myristoyl acyltransferase